jgi:capsular exopolysaccharide synthesis family protein
MEPPPASSPAPVPIALIERAVDPRVVLFHAPGSREAEQFRGLRNSILAMNPEGASRTIVLASSMRGEGATTSTVNLAMALAELAGTRVLVVEANLRDPSLERVLALPHQPGLAELLAERIQISRALRPSLMRHVDVLTAGKPPENPAELLGKGRLKPVLDALKPDYSYVLLDVPPASDYTDASIIARDCDGVVVIVRLEVVPRAMVEQTVQKLRSLGSNLLGAFLVGAETDRPVAIDGASE